MKNRKWMRLILLVLAVGLVAAAALNAGAARFVGDVNGDGKVTVFDAQMLAEVNAGHRTLTAEQQTAAGDSTIQSLLEFIFGKTADVGDFDADGVYEIYSVEGLYHMAENPDLDYILMEDMDLNGAQWTPIVGFSGSLDGNGKKISNFVISTGVKGFNNDADVNMGFFGDTKSTAVISDLHLRDVTLNATEDAGYIGLLAGSCRGQITGCSVTGSINDTRESLNGGKIYVGVMAGRITNGSNGSIVGDTSISVTDDTGSYTVTGLCADVKMNIEDSALVAGGGLVGYAPTGYTVSGIWCDSTSDSSVLSETLQARQNTAVAYMNTMGSVEWQVSEGLEYTPSSGVTSVHHQVFEVNETYYGLPYNQMNGSLERFLSRMDTSTGTNMTVTGLEDGIYTSGVGYTGFIQYMGNDCSSAVGWAWMQISPNQVAGDMGAYVTYTYGMVPNASNQAELGIYPVGDWTYDAESDTIVGDFAYDAGDAFSTRAIYDLNGLVDGTVNETLSREVIAEAYAQSRKADALLFRHSTSTEDPSQGNGHARLLVADPVVIRNADGSIDTAQSFMVTTEQGDGLYDWQDDPDRNSSWRVNYQYTFDSLLETTVSGSDNSSGGVYVPITIRALRSEADMPVSCTGAVTGPDVGTITSNYRIVKSTVTVTDSNGGVIYDGQVYTGVGSSGYRGAWTEVKLSSAHGDAFAAAAEKAGMTAGKLYHYSVEVLLSNGETCVIKDNATFIYANTGSDE